MKIYLAGKVNKDSHFGTSHWRDGVTQELEQKSGLELENLDPVKYELDTEYDPDFVFKKDCWLINQADCVIVYLSDDISVGGSQEMLIAKYLKKPLIGLAPLGGKFKKVEYEQHGKLVQNYIHPFVHSTCDVVCETLDEVARVLKSLPKEIKGMEIIDNAIYEMDDVGL